MANNSDLESRAFERLLSRLDPDRDRAGEKYVQIRRRLSKVLELRGCRNPEEVADRTIDRVARKLEEETEIYARDVYSYFHGVALLILQEFSATPQPLPLKIDPAQRQPEDPAGMERRLDCLRRCLRRLPARDRKAIRLYYQGETHAKIENRKKLAALLGKSQNALRIYIHRIRAQLELCVLECLKKAK